MWSLATHTRTLTVSQDTIKGRKSSPKDVGRGGGYYTHPYDPFISLGGEGDVEWTFMNSEHEVSTPGVGWSWGSTLTPNYGGLGGGGVGTQQLSN